MDMPLTGVSIPSCQRRIINVNLAFANTEHLGTTHRTGALSGRLTILHCYGFGIFDFPLGTAFHTIRFQNLLLFQHNVLIFLIPASV